MIELLWNQICENTGFKIINHKQNGCYLIIITYYHLKEAAQEFNAAAWGYFLYAINDCGIIKGFNPRINFYRRITLIQGNICCNHCYQMEID